MCGVCPCVRCRCSLWHSLRLSRCSCQLGGFTFMLTACPRHGPNRDATCVKLFSKSMRQEIGGYYRGQQFAIDEVYAGILIVGLLGLLINLAFRLVTPLVLPWQRKTQPASTPAARAGKA